MITKEDKDDLRVKVLSQVKYAEKALSLLETLSAAYTQVPSDIREAFIRVKSFFVEKELNAYRDLLLIVNLIGDDEENEATRKAIKRFLSVDMSIMHFWSHNGEIPGSWLDKDEKRLRELFKEIEKEVGGKRKKAVKGR
jgi:hypothetical protein